MPPIGGQKSVMILLLMLQLATVPSPPPPPLANGRPNVVGLFSSDDYPVEAMRNGWEGDVVLDVRVDTAGRARSCRIVQSSGHEVLDLKTCWIMLVRARFRPARDSNGRSVEDVVRTPPVRWRLEQEREPEPESAPQ
jgi:protein TonB